MNKNLKVILIVVGVIFVLVGLPMLIAGFFLSSTIQDVQDSFSSAYTDEDIIEYVKKTHGFDVEVIENEGRKSGSDSLGGLLMEDAVVKTLAPDSTQFTVHISMTGRISGDNYEDVKIRQKLNQALQNSDSYEELESIGFSDIHFGKDKSVPTFTMKFIEERKFGDEETLRMLYESIPIIKEWQDKAAEENVHFDIVNFHDLQMDLRYPYDSWRDLGNRLATENIESFTYQFINQAKEKVDQIDADLNDLNLNSSSLKCYEMRVYDECAAYSLKLSPQNDDNVFQYDEQDNDENLFQAIQLVNNLDLPIEEIKIRIYTPSDPENQEYTAEELIKRDGYAEFITRDVTITNLKEISSVDDIHFEY